MPQTLRVSAAAQALNVSAETVRTWIKLGRIRATRPLGDRGMFLIPSSEIERMAGRGAA